MLQAVIDRLLAIVQVHSDDDVGGANPREKLLFSENRCLFFDMTPARLFGRHRGTPRELTRRGRVPIGIPAHAMQAATMILDTGPDLSLTACKSRSGCR